jgi:hypothetical protein
MDRKSIGEEKEIIYLFWKISSHIRLKLPNPIDLSPNCKRVSGSR